MNGAREEAMPWTFGEKKEEDLYSVLGVRATATKEEIRKNYIALVRDFHPDKNPGTTEVVRRFLSERLARINVAYQTLLDPAKRALYDRARQQDDRDKDRDGAERSEGNESERLNESQENQPANTAMYVLVRCASSRHLFKVNVIKVGENLIFNEPHLSQLGSSSFSSESATIEGTGAGLLEGEIRISARFSCPYCGAKSISKCSCNNALNCWDGVRRTVTCAWCGETAFLSRDTIKSLLIYTADIQEKKLPTRPKTSNNYFGFEREQRRALPFRQRKTV